MKPTISVDVAAKVLGVSPSGAYTSIRQGSFPVNVIKIGSRYAVPTRPLCDLLGLDELPDDLEPTAA